MGLLDKAAASGGEEAKPVAKANRRQGQACGESCSKGQTVKAQKPAKARKHVRLEHARWLADDYELATTMNRRITARQFHHQLRCPFRSYFHLDVGYRNCHDDPLCRQRWHHHLERHFHPNEISRTSVNLFPNNSFVEMAQTRCSFTAYWST